MPRQTIRAYLREIKSAESIGAYFCEIMSVGGAFTREEIGMWTAHLVYASCE